MALQGWGREKKEEGNNNKKRRRWKREREGREEGSVAAAPLHAAFGEKALHKKDTCIGLVSGPDVLIGPSASLAAGFNRVEGGSTLLSIRPTTTPTRISTHTHFARRDTSATTAINVPNGVTPHLPTLAKKKKKGQDFFTTCSGWEKPRPLPPVNYWRVCYCHKTHFSCVSKMALGEGSTFVRARNGSSATN